MKTTVRLSVIVATRNRASSLSHLLDALSSQVNAPSFEIIVSDNGSSDRTQDVVKNARDRLQIHYVCEERPGKSCAINAALKKAQGELIIFTDDDGRPYPDWLARLFDASIRHPDANIFGGLIEVNLEKVPRWIKRSYNLMTLLTSAHNYQKEMFYPYGQYPCGPNMSIRSQLIADFETPYPELLGPGTDCPVGDESAFFIKFSPPAARDRVFIPSAKVFHEVELENLTFLNALRRCFLSGLAHGQIQLPTLSLSPNTDTSILKLILARIRSCKSVRELICISVRYTGYIFAKVSKA